MNLVVTANLSSLLCSHAWCTQSIYSVSIRVEVIKVKEGFWDIFFFQNQKCQAYGTEDLVNEGWCNREATM